MPKFHEESTRLGSPARFSGRKSSGHHRVLGLRSHQNDPLMIITAAQVRLRRWRRLPDHAPEALHSGLVDQIRRIIAARDALLEQTYESLRMDGGSSPVGRG